MSFLMWIFDFWFSNFLFADPCLFFSIRIDFHKQNQNSPIPGDISNSATLKMVRDMDEHTKDLQIPNDPGTWSLQKYFIVF